MKVRLGAYASIAWLVTYATAAALPPNHPDTLLGVRDHFGFIYATDDDGSPLGDGLASGLTDVPTNSGLIEFAITGFTDSDFVGSHIELGRYEVFVDVYDFFEDPVDSFSEFRRLQPGDVHEFSYFNPDWIGGSYDVYIDNTVVPEPASLQMIASAIAVFCGAKRHFRR
jgi:hypothetical protein